MGANFTDTMRGIIASVQTRVSHNPAIRTAIYKDVIPLFEADDWDTQHECMGLDPCFDQAYYALHPNEFKDMTNHD